MLGIADRLIVMREGRISGELTSAQASETAALNLALPDKDTPNTFLSTPETCTP